jgi:hypothetical protein
LKRKAVYRCLKGDRGNEKVKKKQKVLKTEVERGVTGYPELKEEKLKMAFP